MQVEQQFQDGMSRERFWQEVALAITRIGFGKLFDQMFDPDRVFTEKDVEKAMQEIARRSFDGADVLAERHGPDNLPRSGITSRAVK